MWGRPLNFFIKKIFKYYSVQSHAFYIARSGRAAMHASANWIGRWESPECGDKIYFVSHLGTNSLETLYTFYSALPATCIRLGEDGEEFLKKEGHPTVP